MNNSTVLLRQVHPNFCPDGQLSSQAFFPFPKDEGQLSVYDSDLIGPVDAYQHYTLVLGFESLGSWGVTASEAASVELSCRPDPLPNFLQHAVIDFTAHSPKNWRKLSKKLRDFAAARGCLFSQTE